MAYDSIAELFETALENDPTLSTYAKIHLDIDDDSGDFPNWPFVVAIFGPGKGQTAVTSLDTDLSTSDTSSDDYRLEQYTFFIKLVKRRTGFKNRSEIRNRVTNKSIFTLLNDTMNAIEKNWQIDTGIMKTDFGSVIRPEKEGEGILELDFTLIIEYQTEVESRG